MSTHADDTMGRVAAPAADRILDAARHAAHLSHKTRLAKTLAEDALEEGMHAARRAAVRSMRRGFDRLDDLKYEGARRVRQSPLRTVVIGAAAGFLTGMATAWLAGRLGSGRARNR